MNRRLWYPQLDAYDAIRRMAVLLSFWGRRPPSRERLFISDFYFANPPLLHKTHMPRPVRAVFNELQIVKPEKAFVSFPSPPVLFQKMEQVQKQAFQTLVAKGLINLEALDRGFVISSEAGAELFGSRFLPLLGEAELMVAKFLTRQFTRVGEDENTGLRRSTGLRRINR